MASKKKPKAPAVRGSKTWTGKVYRCESWEALGLCPSSKTTKMPRWIGEWRGTEVTITLVGPPKKAKGK